MPKKSIAKSSAKSKANSSDASLPSSSPMDMDDLVKSLINESAYLREVLNCSFRLAEIFDPDHMADLVAESFNSTCKGVLRVWRNGKDGPVVMGTTPHPLPKGRAQSKLLKHVQQAFEDQKLQVSLDGFEGLWEVGHVMEFVQLPDDYPYATYLGTLYFKHLVQALNTLKDRLVIAKAYQEIREILELKNRVENGLQDIKDHSTLSINRITDHLEEIINLSRQKQDDISLPHLNQLAVDALNETQVGDLTNQKIFASLKNLETLFFKLTDSLDPMSKNYLNSISKPKEPLQTENVVSQSIMKGEASDQSSVDALLAELGL